ncbi:MAG: zinc ribbon domain-containing protein [Methanoregula sp.]|nr:MAG: zinc ribbon domain-containing protein [Methanoregula sp.]
MPFCPTCGKEISEIQKFCEYCGAAQDIYEIGAKLPGDQPPPPPPPEIPVVQPPLPPSAGKKPLPKNAGIIFGVIVIIAVVAVFCFFGMQVIKAGFSPLIQQPAHTLSPTTLPTPPPTMTPLPVTTIQTQKIVTDERFEETYEELYNRNLTYNFGQKELFPVDLTRPPLFIKFTIIPVMVNRSKLVDIGLSTEHIVYAVYPDPNSWFEVRILDAVSGTVVAAKGFNKEYDQQTKNEFMVREKGRYNVEMAGNGVTVNTQILVGD